MKRFALPLALCAAALAGCAAHGTAPDAPVTLSIQGGGRSSDWYRSDRIGERRGGWSTRHRGVDTRAMGAGPAPTQRSEAEEEGERRGAHRRHEHHDR